MAAISPEMLEEAQAMMENPQALANPNQIDYDNGLADEPLIADPNAADYGFSKIEEGVHPFKIKRATLVKQPGQPNEAAFKLLVIAGPEKGKEKDQRFNLGVGWQLAGFFNLAAACGLYDKEKGAQYYNTARDFEGKTFWGTIKHTKKEKTGTDGETKLYVYANLSTDGYHPIDRFPVPVEDPFAEKDGSRMPPQPNAPPGQVPTSAPSSVVPSWGSKT